MKHSKTLQLRLIGVIGMCIFVNTANVSYAFGDAPPEDTKEKASPGVSNEQSEGESGPVSRDFEQMEKDDARYMQPGTTQEVPFHSTDEKVYRDAKEKP